MRSSNPKLWSNQYSLTKGILGSDVPPMICVSNLVSLCAIFTNLQASLVILAGLLATNNSSQLSPVSDHSSPFTIHDFPLPPYTRQSLSITLLRIAQAFSRPFAALTQAAKVAKKATREEPFLFLLLYHLLFPLRTFPSLHVSPSPCLHFFAPHALPITAYSSSRLRTDPVY